jgi:hypothetical protein
MQVARRWETKWGVANRWDTVRERVLIMAQRGAKKAEKVLQALVGLIAEIRRIITEKKEQWRIGRIEEIAGKLLEDDDEFRHAVKALKARKPIYKALENETDDIWRRTRLDQNLVGIRTIYIIGMVIVVVGLIYAVVSANAWLRDNWSGNGPVTSDLKALVVSAYTQWYAIGEPDRWIYLFGAVAFLVIVWQVTRATLRDLPLIRREWKRGLEEELRPRIRVELNKLTNDKYPRTLTSLSAPGLGETPIPYRLIARGELARIKRWNEELGASAIAISGYRGVGKTTLLRSIIDATDHEDDDKPTAIFVAAPVTYDSREFLIHLYSQLCRLVIGVTGPARSRGALMLRRILRPIFTFLRWTIRFGLLLLLAWAWIWIVLWVLNWLPSEATKAWAVAMAYAIKATNIQTPHGMLATILATSLVIVGWGLAGKLAIPRSSLKAPPDITRLAERGLERMQFLQTVSTEASAGVKRGFLDLGAKRARQLAENPITLPELVDSYRGYAEEVATWLYSSPDPASGLFEKIAPSNLFGSIRSGRYSRRLMICIDEVDRIATAEAAESFINDIKAIFGVKHCVYLVTVSEEALAGFEQRLIRVRPALDSAFDEVLRLDIFNVGQSVELLRRHVVGFPDIFISLCHCLAGGIPRDLVREARALLDETSEARPGSPSSKANGSDAPSANLIKLTAATVTRSVMTLKRGLVMTAMAEPVSEQRQGTLPLLVSEAWPGDPGDEMLGSISSLYESGHNDRESVELCAAVFFYATVYDVFTRRTHAMVREIQAEKSKTAKIADRLAVVRGLLAVSPTMAIEELNKLRQSLDLTQLVPNTDASPAGGTGAAVQVN